MAAARRSIRVLSSLLHGTNSFVHLRTHDDRSEQAGYACLSTLLTTHVHSAVAVSGHIHPGPRGFDILVVAASTQPSSSYHIQQLLVDYASSPALHDLELRLKPYDGDVAAHVVDLFHMIRASQLSEDDLSARLNCFLRFVVRRSHRAIASRFQDAHAHWSGQSPIDILESDWSMPHDLPVSSFKLPPALRDCLARFGLHTNAEDTYRVDVQNLQLWKTAFASLYRDVESGLLDPPVEGSSKPAIKSHIPDEDIARLAEAFRRLSLLLISKLADAIFSIPSLSDRFLKLRPNTVSKIGGYIGSETNEIYNYSSELEGAGAHALRYLRLCCAHVTAARFVFVHPAFQQRLPLRIRLVTYPPADPRPSPACIDDLRAGITDDSPNAANAIAALETVRVEVRHGTLHPEAVILALAHASLPGGEVAADPPPAGFVETAHALARFFHEDESVSVGVHQDCCPSCAMLNIDLSEGDFPDIFFSPGHGTAVPWTPPPGLPSWVLKEGLKDRAAMLRSQYLSAWDTHRLSILAAV